MATLLKVVLAGAGVIVLAAAALYVAGTRLPVQHMAAVRLTVAAPLDDVFGVIRDVAAAPAWRSGLDRVEILSVEGEPLRWRETTSFGTLEFTTEAIDPPRRIVGRVRDPEGQFGGRWIFELEPDPAGTRVTITEEGEVYSALFRALSKYVFGHYGTLERYGHDLQKRFGDDAPVERLSRR